MSRRKGPQGHSHSSGSMKEHHWHQSSHNCGTLKAVGTQIQVFFSSACCVTSTHTHTNITALTLRPKQYSYKNLTTVKAEYHQSLRKHRKCRLWAQWEVISGFLWKQVRGYHAIKSRSTGTLDQMSQELCNAASCHFKWRFF